jgi:hypothetical protein
MTSPDDSATPDAAEMEAFERIAVAAAKYLPGLLSIQDDVKAVRSLLSRPAPVGLSREEVGESVRRDAVAKECRAEYLAWRGSNVAQMYTWETLPDHHKSRWLGFADRILALARYGQGQGRGEA